MGRSGDFAGELPVAERERLLQLLGGDDLAAPGAPGMVLPDTVTGSVTVVLGDGPVGTYRDALDATTSVGGVLAQVLEIAEAMVPPP